MAFDRASVFRRRSGEEPEAMPFHFYMKVTGTTQGGFTKESARWEERQLCYRFRFKGTANSDPTRSADQAARAHDPIYVLKEWGPASPQFMQAFWRNEVLTEVT